MKVLMVFPAVQNYRTGITSFVNNLSKSLEKKHYEVEIIRFTTEKESKVPPKDDIFVYSKKINSISFYHLASVVKKEVLRGKYDIVHGQGGTSILHKVLGSKVPTLVTNHGIWYMINSSYWDFKILKKRQYFWPYVKYFPHKATDIMMGKLLYNKADRITTVSNFCKHEVSKIYGVPEQKIDSIPNGVSVDLFSTNIPKRETDEIKGRYDFEKALIFVKPIPRKGLHLLIKALPAIIKQESNIKLLIVGHVTRENTYFKFCYELAKKLNVSDRLIFTDWVSDVDLPKYYSVSSALVLPSLYEALPITILESMACGTPACTSMNGGLSEVVTDGEDGILFDPANSSSLSDVLIAFLSDNALQKRLRFNARKKIEQHYSWDHIAEQYAMAYKKTCAT